MVSVVRRYYLYRGTLSPGFYIPVSVVYMQAQGLGLAEIGFVQGSFSLAMVVSELPTGYVADRLGRRTALATGSGIVVAVMLGFTVADSTATFTAVYVLWAVGWTFRTGIADSWLYELLAEQDTEGEHARISGRADSTLRMVSAVTALSAGLLYTVDPAHPFLANAGLAAFGHPVLYTLPETGGTHDENDEEMRVIEAARILRTNLSRPSVRWIVVYAALFNLAFSVTRAFEQPAMRAVGIPVTGLGALYAGFKLVSAVESGAAGPVQDRLGTRGVILSLVPVVGIAYASFSLFPLLLVPALFLRRGVQRVTRPVRTEYLNDRLEDAGRATVLSGVSMVLTLASGTANDLGGRVAAVVGPMTFLSATGVAVAVLGGVLWLVTYPVREPATDPTPS
jgi:MFS family permease